LKNTGEKDQYNHFHHCFTVWFDIIIGNCY